MTEQLRDAGPLKLEVSNVNGTIRLGFGKKVQWIEMPTEKAVELALVILEQSGLKLHRVEAQNG
jgi:hypothetical protein